MGAVCVGWGLPAPPWWVRLADWVRAMFAKKEAAPEPVVQADTCAAAERLLNQYGDAILRLGLFLSPQPGGRGGHGTGHFDEVFADCSETGQPGA